MKLVNSMSGKWKPEKYKDEYKLAVEKWVNQKIHHRPETAMRSRTPQAAASSGKTVDFVELLKKSLQSKKGGNGGVEAKRRGAKIKHLSPSKRKAHRRVASTAH